MKLTTKTFLLIAAFVPLVAQAEFNLNMGFNPVAGEGPSGPDASYLAFTTPHEQATTGARQDYTGISFSEGGLVGPYTVGFSFTYVSPDGDDYVIGTRQSFDRGQDGSFGQNSFGDDWVGLDTRSAVGGEGNGSTYQLNFYGLEASTEYILTTYHFDTSGGGGSSFTTSVTGPTVFDNILFNGSNSVLDSAYDFTLISDGSGNATIEHTTVGGAFLRVNGLDLAAVPVPEPSSYALLSGLFGLVFVTLRYRRGR